MRLTLIIFAALLNLPLFAQDTIKFHFELLDKNSKKLKVKFTGVEHKIIKKKKYKDEWYQSPYWVNYKLIVPVNTNKIKAEIIYNDTILSNTYNFSLPYRGKDVSTTINTWKQNIWFENNQPEFYSKYPQWIGVSANKKLSADTIKHAPNKETIDFLDRYGLYIDSTVIHVFEWTINKPDGTQIPETDTNYVFLIAKKSGETFNEVDSSLSLLRKSKLFYNPGPIMEKTNSFTMLGHEIKIHWINPDKEKEELFRKYNIILGENAYEYHDFWGYSCNVIYPDNYGYKIVDIINDMNQSGDFIASTVSFIGVEFFKIIYLE